MGRHAGDIDDLGPVETNAHLLRYDSVHGRFPGEVKVKGDTIDVGFGPIKAGLAAAIAMTTSPAVVLFMTHETRAEGQVTERASGTLSISRPNRFRWDYQQPYAQTIVADGVPHALTEGACTGSQRAEWSLLHHATRRFLRWVQVRYLL